MDEVTVKDVASYAGVAVSTVSRVINNLDRVSPKTREKVLNAVKELGFVRNDFAASIKSGASHFIVISVPDTINEVYWSVIQGAERVFARKGYHTLIYVSGEKYKGKKGCIDDNLIRIADGVLLIQSINNAYDLKDISKPIVLVDREKKGSDKSSVTLNNYEGAVKLTEELIHHGHTKIAMIIGKSSFNVMTDRKKGFLDTLKKYSISIPKEYMCMGDWHQETGYSKTMELLRLDNPPTAIFAGNNRIAMGCIEYCESNHIEIGKDISLVQFDDSHMAKFLCGGITSVVSPMETLGERGAEMLLEALTKSNFTIRKEIVDVSLVSRKSVVRIK